MTLLTFENLSRCGGLVHAVTTAAGPGGSQIIPFNLADHAGANRQNAIAARRFLLKTLRLPFENLTLPQQVHGDRIAIVDHAHIGKGATGRSDCVPDADALVTTLPHVPLMVLSADCALIVAYDPQARVLGVAHAGWRSSLAAIAVKLIETMTVALRARPGRILAAISPAAGACCYQIGGDVIAALRRSIAAQNCLTHRDGATFLDLQNLNRSQLLQAGIKADNIDVINVCTICDRRFFSYRRQGEHAGRFALIAAMVDGEITR